MNGQRGEEPKRHVGQISEASPQESYNYLARAMMLFPANKLAQA
tara:strand:+ start:509 stop:640 length:132 start_codon:yes stop_codon:yes gene_type:complete